MSEKKKILVTLDGSKRAERTIDYLCRFTPFKDRDLVLFNITTPIPEAYYDLSRDAFSKMAVSQVKAWEAGQKQMMNAFFKEARTRLVEAGYDKDRIEFKLATREKGIARGILSEAQNEEYQALVIRRRGNANSILGVTLGGTAAKIVEKADSIPLIVAGTREANNYLCIAVDGSEGSERSVEFAANMMGKSECRILLCAIMRNTVPDDVQEGKDPFADMCVRAYNRLEKAIESAKATLTQAGIPEDRIESRIIQGAESRAATILDTARKAECDTLVLGRKGLSGSRKLRSRTNPQKNHLQLQKIHHLADPLKIPRHAFQDV